MGLALRIVRSGRAVVVCVALGCESFGCVRCALEDTSVALGGRWSLSMLVRGKSA